MEKIDNQAAIRDFHDETILMAKLAICLLALKENNASDLGEDLSWLIGLLSFMGGDVELAIDIMTEYFSMNIKKQTFLNNDAKSSKTGNGSTSWRKHLQCEEGLARHRLGDAITLDSVALEVLPTASRLQGPSTGQQLFS